MPLLKSPPQADPSANPNTRLTLPLGFLALTLLWCQIGYLNPSISRPLGAIIWLFAVSLSYSNRRWFWVVLHALLLCNPWGAVFRREGLLLLGLLVWTDNPNIKRWLFAAFLIALGNWVWAYLPSAWAFYDRSAAHLAQGIAGANLSGSAAGFPLFGIALSFALATLFADRRPFAFLITTTFLFLSLLLFWVLLNPIAGLLHQLNWSHQSDAFNLQDILVGFLSLALWARERKAPSVPASLPPKKLYLLSPVLLFAGIVLMGLPPRLGSPEKNKQIIFFDRGYLNWQTPEYGLYGQHAGGMFGLLPEYLKGRDFQVVRADSLSPTVLERAGVVVIINLIGGLTESEEHNLEEFVVAGGSLFLLGDHTGLSDIREPSNRVLKPYGIELNFDSAKPQRTGWIGSLICAEHPLTTAFGLDRLESSQAQGLTQIWIGASLTVTPPGQPLIVGREAFSDLGDLNNKKDGYLGDFRYEKKERLGDLVLVAEARQGKGKVLVFGDTSTLQNGALARAGDFVSAIFQYLLSPTQQSSVGWKIGGFILLLVALFLWVITGASSKGLCFCIAALFLGALHSQYRLASPLLQSQSGWTEQASPRALIDHSHAPRTPLNQVSPDGHWGLQNCLLRSGFLPRTLERWDEATLDDSRLLIEIAPARSFSKKQKAALRQYMSKGGIVLLTCGYEEEDGSRSLLQDYGIALLSIPLGPAEVKTKVSLPESNDPLSAPSEQELTVTFHSAWPVKVNYPLAKILLEGYNQPLIVFLPVGSGGLIVIPDTDFLTNRNLESPISPDYKEGNILYLRYLLRTYAGGK